MKFRLLYRNGRRQSEERKVQRNVMSEQYIQFEDSFAYFLHFTTNIGFELKFELYSVSVQNGYCMFLCFIFEREF